MARYCHECGTELFDDTSKFCSKCGVKTIKDISPLQKPIPIQSEPVVHKEEIKDLKKNSHSVGNGIIFIFVALGVLFTIYAFPMASIGGKSLSVADLNLYCSNPLINVLSGNSCSLYSSLFYIGWVIVVVIIIVGIYEMALAMKN